MDRRLKTPVLTLAILVLALGALATGCGGGTASNAPATTQTSEPAGSNEAQNDSTAGADPAEGEPRAAAQHSTEAEAIPAAPAPARSQPAAPANPPAHANGATSHGSGAATPAQPSDVARTPVVKTIPAGTTMSLTLQEEVSSQTSQVGQAVHARVIDPMVVDGAVVVPAGAMLEGTVTEAVPQKKIGGTSKLTIAFDTLRMQSGATVPVAATFAFVGKSQTGKDAATIGGSAAGGALLGKILGGKSKDAAIGAVVGGAVGTAVAAKNKGDIFELPAGSALNVTLDTPVEVTISR